MSDAILINKMEDTVVEIVDRLIYKDDSGVCNCSRCRLDIIALALNSLPPKYAVTTMGNAVTNVTLDSYQWKANVTMAVCSAIEIVKGRPRH
jgi:competence protein ComFB